MPEPLTDAELGLDPQQMEGLDPNIRAELRRSRQLQADANAANERAAAAERNLAFAKAGIPDSPLGQMFAKAYDGSADDPAAIKAAFDALGGPAAPPAADPPQPPAPEGATEAELAEQRRLAQVGGSSAGDGSVRFEDALRSAKSEAELLDLIANAPAESRIAPVEVQ